MRDPLWLGTLTIEGYLLSNSQTWGTHICGSVTFLFWRFFVFNIKATRYWLDTAQAASSVGYNHQLLLQNHLASLNLRGSFCVRALPYLKERCSWCSQIREALNWAGTCLHILEVNYIVNIYDPLLVGYSSSNLFWLFQSPSLIFWNCKKSKI